jgi:hypothetical protein
LRESGKLLPDLEKNFSKIAAEFGGGKEGVAAASSHLVEESLKGKYGISRIIFDLEGISDDALNGSGKLLKGATNSELGVVLRHLNEGPISGVDIIFKTSETSSLISKGTQTVEGSPLPKFVLDKLSNPAFQKPIVPPVGVVTRQTSIPKATGSNRAIAIRKNLSRESSSVDHS